MIDSDVRQQLVAAALAARKRAYAPYSKFLVGAAVLAEEGLITAGANVENASYGLTICAERVAATAAVAAGARALTAVAIATSGGASPCGACRQVLAEFGGAMEVILVDADDPTADNLTADNPTADNPTADNPTNVRTTTLDQLLPEQFLMRPAAEP